MRAAAPAPGTAALPPGPVLDWRMEETCADRRVFLGWGCFGAGRRWRMLWVQSQIL
ncbi:hypothetical protein COCSUDRAFT_33884, partial [Coccomyxa subellipsoidea C-169]